MAYPLSQGYLLVDSKKCQGCQLCMMTCSLVHEGEVNLSLARIQVMQNILENWPYDIRIAQCRQCANPKCVKACPTGALYIDAENGNLRLIDASKCDGCKLCIDACPYLPSRIIWNPVKNQAIKCDLCLNTPFWDEPGGADGRQICVEICPQRAIQLTANVPRQAGDAGYDINLRDEAKQ